MSRSFNHLPERSGFDFLQCQAHFLGLTVGELYYIGTMMMMLVLMFVVMMMVVVVLMVVTVLMVMLVSVFMSMLILRMMTRRHKTYG